jgi:hypothetical protein
MTRFVSSTKMPMFFADLRIERLEGENGLKRALVIEIKMFLTGSAIHNLEVAVGQYTTYRSVESGCAGT